MINKIKQIKKNKSSSSRQMNLNHASILLPLFNHANISNEYFTIEDIKPQPEQCDKKVVKNICLGRYINNKEMLSHVVYAKKMTKDNRIVFENKRDKGKEFSQDLNNNSYLYKLTHHADMTLLFESSFECGNLLAAFKLEPTFYQLLLQSDTNTTGFNKWFFFMVNNMRKGFRYTFTIINNLRQNKHYAKGIKIFTYSNKKNATEKIGWHHSGDDIELYPNNLYQFNNNKKQRLYTFTFTYQCEYENDVIYFVNCIPYSYSKVMTYLNQYNNKLYQYYTQNTLCQSLGGYNLDYFIINTQSKTQSEKEGIVFFARQHPSETVGSWVIQGAIDFLFSQSEEAVYLREHFEILVIPMVNIDGVIAGNTRTSYAGCDLNRKWKRPKKNKHPEIFYIKELIRLFSIKRKIMCLVDFHGHHGAFNSFFYSNYNEKDINQARAFPYACAKNSDCINFDQCSFSMMKYKHGSGRINLYKEFGIVNACTLETSCFGFDKGKYASQYINENILQEIGRDVCMGVITYHYYRHLLLHIPSILSIRIQDAIRPMLTELLDGKMNIKEEDFTDSNGDNSDDEDYHDNDVCVIEDDEEDNLDDYDNRDKDKWNNDNKTEIASYNYRANKLPKIKKIQLKVNNNNIIEKQSSPQAKTETSLNHQTEIKRKNSINKQNGTLMNILNGTSLSFPLKTSVNSKNKSNFPLAAIIKIKESIYSTRVKNAKSIQNGRPLATKKEGTNLLVISPKKFYSTREAITQTEDIFFEIKLIYCIGSHKMIGFDAERERQTNKKRINYLNTLNTSNDERGLIKNNKENKATQT